MVQITSQEKKMNHNAAGQLPLPLPEQEKMDSGRGKRAMEFEQNEFRKRQNTMQSSFDSNVFPVPYPLYNLLNEPSPLGLRMKKSRALLELIQSRLSQVNINSSKKEVTKGVKKDVKPRVKISGPTEKLKASNFPALLLRIGNWEYKSRHEGELVAKCYFAKHKLVWEVLDGGLKNKIEIQWADIVGLKADCPDNGPGTLTVVLDKQPLFFRETDPQPRKHTIWLATTDFTDGNASAYRQHYLYCAPGVLNTHYEKLIRYDTRLNLLSQQSNVFLEAPVEYANVLNNNHNSSSNHIDFVKEYGHVESSGQATGSKGTAPVNAPGSHPAILSDVVNYVSDPSTPGAINLNHMLENLSRFLLTDTQLTAALDAKRLVSRVNSLYALAPDENGSNDNPNPDERNNQVKEWHDGNDHSNPVSYLTTDENENESGMSKNESCTDIYDMLPEIVDL